MGAQKIPIPNRRVCQSMAAQNRGASALIVLPLVERFRCGAMSVPKSRVMGDCQARFRERLWV